MSVELRLPERHMGAVLKELTGKRRADVHEITAPVAERGGGGGDSRHVVRSEVPLASLVRLGGMAAGRRPTPEAAVGAMLAYVEACLVPGARP